MGSVAAPPALRRQFRHRHGLQRPSVDARLDCRRNGFDIALPNRDAGRSAHATIASGVWQDAVQHQESIAAVGRKIADGSRDGCDVGGLSRRCASPEVSDDRASQSVVFAHG